MNIAKCGPRFVLSAGTLSILLAFPQAADAFQFTSDSGELTGSFDTTISLGAAWRTQSRDPALVGIANGGTSRSVNEDDGDLNYDKNDGISGAVKVTHELELKYRNFGFFTRGIYFYDHVANNKDKLGPIARQRTVNDAKLLDAYVRGSFEIGERKLNVRVGNQVVSWGESTFLTNGINVINPVDVSKLRVPGSELKEGLIPSTMLWASQELSDKVTVEGFVLNNFDKTRIDPRSTYFSANDFLSDDSNSVFAGFGRRKDTQSPLTSPLTDPAASVWAVRGNDREAKDRGQYGIALRLFAPEMNDTEFGFYHINYHSRTPLASGVKGTVTSSLTGTPTGTAIGHTGTARYFAEYPENIRLYGVSFSTGIPGGIALQGEYSYRQNQPLQIAAPEVLLATLGLANQITGSTAAAAAVPAGTEISGYRRVQMQQIQISATKAFGPTFGAEQLAVVGEVGYTRLNLPSGLSFNGPGVYLPAAGSSTTTSFGSNQTEGFATANSWGYRLLARLDFPNALGPATVSPRIAFSHDVDGVSPTFNEGAKAVTVGVGFNFKQNWQADIAYTNFFGGRTYSGTDPNPGGPPTQSRSYASSANPLKDRDFVAVSVSYSF